MVLLNDVSLAVHAVTVALGGQSFLHGVIGYAPWKKKTFTSFGQPTRLVAVLLLVSHALLNYA